MDLLAMHNAPEEIAAREAAIRREMLEHSPRIRQGNFEDLGVEDLRRLFDLYDRHFFEGWLARTVQAQSYMPLGLKLSSRMIRAGGRTTRTRRRRHGRTQVSYEIAIAGRMLLTTFRDIQRQVAVCGRDCTDRLDALQRILEHEIIHLCEMLAWGRSSCAGSRFQALAANLFGHDGTKHELVTPREEAAIRHGLAVGSVVRFEHAGREFTGRINRIHRRATVLVEDPKGQPFSDGKKYLGFYVPLERLTLVPARAS